ncbi:MSCRAMM family adhesin SdrC [Sporosarcina aquimarina]|uniref:MSCRAMM family adhesin SdrC n=1 Tax=Sporosarcina aquimarina TaxID=114975 RepID=UPI00203B5F7B|nr:MSCRAMM family adhesin SdrC [Sporosarcina aquimarina]MCM3756550.1 MSCRAMM family adhesin SdrC [Sporosarcina aquimarina]
MKNKKLLYTALSASLLLAACGTDTSEEDSDKQSIENTDQTVDTGTNETESTDGESGEAEGTESTDENATSEEDEATEEDSTSDSNSEADSSESNEVATLPDAVETESDEQPFKMQVLPTYELTSEEPGRDILYLKEHEDKFMVIGTMQATETDFDKAVENMKETLAATSTDASPVELTDETKLPTSKELEKVQAYRVTSADGPITAMIFQKGELIVRVMMYDNNDESYYEEYLKMAETIQPK